MRNDKKDPALKMPTPAELGGETGATQLRKLLIDSLKDIYWAELQLIKKLPAIQEAATTVELKTLIEEHLIQTSDHGKRLTQVFQLCGEQAEAHRCEAMAGLLKEGDQVIEQTPPGSMTRDAGIILAAQKVEHYEIATYGGLLEFARTLGLKEVAGLLDATLDEEKAADHSLTIIAQTGINWQAEHEPVEEQSESLQ